MSEVMIALLLLVPIFVVIFILTRAHKKHKKKAQAKILGYVTEATKKTGTINCFQQQLIHQTVILDVVNRKLLIVDHREEACSHEVCSFDHIDSVDLVHHTESLEPMKKGQKAENISTMIGIELRPGIPGGRTILTLYDYLKHNIYQMPQLQKEALKLKERIENLKRNRLVLK